MDDDLLARPKPLTEQMGIGIAGQQEDLEEQHAGSPNPGTASKPGQNIFGDERLDLEHQEGAQEDGEGKNPHAANGVERRSGIPDKSYSD